ncbi:MAG: IS200/IS605 family transposase [Phycisphaerae bacterium]
MSSHVYHEIFLHLNWHTKGDAPILKGEVESHTHEVIRSKCRELKGVSCHAIGGTDTHVHLVVSIEPFVTVSEIVQELKGSSAYQVNREINSKLLQWQRGYGVVSFGKRNLEWVRDYIARQREHHAQDQVIESLELCDECIRAERTGK